MLNILKPFDYMALPIKPDACFLLVSASVAVASFSWDTLIQNYAAVITLALVTVLIVESIPSGYLADKLLLYIKLLFLDLFLIALIGGVLAGGKWATGIRWYALLATLSVFDLTFNSVCAQWLNKKMQLRFDQMLEDLETTPQKYEKEAEEKLKVDKTELPRHFKKIRISTLITFIVVEIILIFVLWLYKKM